MVDIRALERVLEAPSLVEVLWLEESSEACVCAVEKVTWLIRFIQILPILAAVLIFREICRVPEADSHTRYAKIVVAVFESA